MTRRAEVLYRSLHKLSPDVDWVKIELIQRRRRICCLVLDNIEYAIKHGRETELDVVVNNWHELHGTARDYVSEISPQADVRLYAQMQGQALEMDFLLNGRFIEEVTARDQVTEESNDESFTL